MPRPWNPNYTPAAPKDIRTVKRRAHHTCQNCGNPGTEVDHITPVSQGGTHDLDNLQLLCRRCHKAKTNRERAEARAKAQTNPKATRPTPTHPGFKAL